jgi:hypothetical protein
MARLKNDCWSLRFWCAYFLLIAAADAAIAANELTINFDPLDRAVARFNAMENEPVINLVSNSQSALWLRAEIPLFECPDPSVEEIYYFRWWAFRKHLRRGADTGGRYVFTEFITRPKPVSSALGHHLAEGRWLRDSKYLDETVLYWLRGGVGGQSQTHLHKYSQWLAHAIYTRACVTGDERSASHAHAGPLSHAATHEQRAGSHFKCRGLTTAAPNRYKPALHPRSSQAAGVSGNHNHAASQASLAPGQGSSRIVSS